MFVTEEGNSSVTCIFPLTCFGSSDTVVPSRSELCGSHINVSCFDQLIEGLNTYTYSAFLRGCVLRLWTEWLRRFKCIWLFCFSTYRMTKLYCHFLNAGFSHLGNIYVFTAAIQVFPLLVTQQIV